MEPTEEVYAPGDLPIRIRPSSSDDANIIREIWEEDVYHLSSLSDVETVLDVGANIGLFTLAVGWRFPSAKIYAVEPELDNLRVLRENLALYAHTLNVRVIEKAIWHHADGVFIDPREGSSVVDSTSGEYRVESQTLPQLFEEYNIKSIDLMKMDVECAEYPIFSVMTDEIAQRINHIKIEFHDTTATQYGNLLAVLSRTHHVRAMGSYERGGMIHAWRY